MKTLKREPKWLVIFRYTTHTHIDFLLQQLRNLPRQANFIGSPTRKHNCQIFDNRINAFDWCNNDF